MQTDRKKLHAYTYSAQRVSLTARTVRVEADITPGVYAFSIIGLPDKAVDEARGRVSAAIKHAGFIPPERNNQKVIVSLSPGELRKTGTLFDVPIALTYLLANKNIHFNPEGKLFVGELTLDGNLEKAVGMLPLLQHAKQEGFPEIYIPATNAEEAALIDGITIFPCMSLGDIITHLSGEKRIEPVTHIYTPSPLPENNINFTSIKGQESVKRALSVAGAGGHNIALYGPPGTGKTLLARSLVSILPPLTKDECVEVTALHSITRNVTDPIGTPPFRNPHHTSSHTSVIGGGTVIRPGEISLAHRGVLFMDEFPEFDRRVIESLREPLEEHSITITRSSGIATFPASCILVIAFNLCPCGNTGTDKVCTCSPATKQSYRKKLTGPIVDRIDVWVSVEATGFEELGSAQNTDDLARCDTVKQAVWEAREAQRQRYDGTPINLNNEIDADGIERYISISSEASSVLQQAAVKMSLSPRGYHRTMKCARTIADMENSEVILPDHIFEAVSYRVPPSL